MLNESDGMKEETKNYNDKYVWCNHTNTIPFVIVY